MVIKVFSAFSGYGGAEFSLQKANIDFEVVGYSEIDKNAIKCYDYNHPGIKNFGDITKINPDDIEDFDLFTGGFPCTSYSIAGKKLGEQDPRGVGKLFYEIIRICEKKQPKWILLENVKGFTFEKFEESFNMVCSELDRIGYVVKHKLINSKNYGTPQNRERIYFVCYRKDLKIESNPFPKEQELNIFIKDILEKEVDKKYYLTEKAINQINEHNKKNEELEFGFRNLPLNKYFVSPTLCSFTMENTLKFIEEENILLDNNHKDINGNIDNREYNKTSPTITTFSAKNLILNKKISTFNTSRVLSLTRIFPGRNKSR